MKSFSKRSHRALRSEVFREYCESSSIHGVQYFDRVERTPCERFWWIVVFLLSMTGCGVMIYKAYVKWNQAPIIVSFSEKTTPVWDIQFPAITICPETKVSSAKLNFTSEISKLVDEISNNTINSFLIGQLKAVAQLCNMFFLWNNDYLAFMNGTRENDVINMLKNISLSRHDVIGVCYYDSSFERCGKHLKETVTEDGLCYSFNMMPENKIFRKNSLHSEHQYINDWIDHPENASRLDNHETTPLYASGSGLHAGLRLFLKQDKADTDYMCTGFSQGYKLMLHESNEYPQVSKRNIRIPHSNEISIALKPQMIVTSQSAADYDWQKRQCFFNHERYLRFFQVYNQDNCELECLTNVTLAVCGCVRFSMPRANGTLVCPLNARDCMDQARSHYRQNRNSPHMDDVESTFARCNCLPACSSIHYDVEITQSSLDIEKFLRANYLMTDYSDNYQISTLEIYFKESHFITSKRSELYGLVDFLANCGGLLGLFMGVSILSLVEICYFIAIRPFSVRRRVVGDEKKKINEANNSLLAVVSKVD